MIKAGALIYALFLILVISIISSSFILINYYNSRLVLQSLKTEELYRNVNSGIHYGLSLSSEIPIDTQIEVDLFEDETAKVFIGKKQWGAFYVLSATARWRNKKAFKTALVGGDINEGEHIALYLADQNKPLALTGKTIITGTCYLPKSGVKRAYIEGKSFVGNQLINGVKKNSSKTLPPINTELITANYNNFSPNESLTDSIMDYDFFEEQDSIVNSFQNKTLVLYSSVGIEISGKFISGNVIIKSDQEIIINKSALLSNTILYAKGIVLKESVEGDMQLFAKDSILISKNCQLNYPSVVGLIGKGKSTSSRKLICKEDVIIKGAVFLYNENFDRKNQAILSVGKGTQLTGQVYSSELLELKGTIIGSASCQNIILKTASSVYGNHLMDAVINRNELSPSFVGVSLTESIRNHSIIKWIN
jgi:cytoskeletal protein CcmA (bactofilin family)